jgi:hypothetical protein
LYQFPIKYSKWPQSIEKVMKHIQIFHSKGFQNVKKLGVWFENKPFGNPDLLKARPTDKTYKFVRRQNMEIYVRT